MTLSSYLPTFATLKLEQSGTFLTLTINRPKQLNALSDVVLGELLSLLEILRQKPSGIQGMLLTSAGDRAFVAGADIKTMSQLSPKDGEAFGWLGQQVTLAFEALPFPVIACVDGHALGGGCEVAMSCDYIYATQDAVFGQPEVNLGLIPGFGGCVRLMQYVGVAKARELIYTGRSIEAKEAKELGLVSEVFATKGEMIQAAMESLKLVAIRSPHAVQICKQVIRDAVGLTTTEALKVEKAGFRKAFEHPEKTEGVTAFLEKRHPNF